MSQRYDELLEYAIRTGKQQDRIREGLQVLNIIQHVLSKWGEQELALKIEEKFEHYREALKTNRSGF